MSNNRAGFTLVELSIVVLIIGLITTGIVSGSGLIKQAQLNSVISDLQNYNISYNSFNARYGAPPGDFTAAQTLWPTCSADITHVPCIGNGNGLIDSYNYIPGSSSINEMTLAWRELYLAGLISGNIDQITFINNKGGGSQGIGGIGASFPASKIQGGGFVMAYSVMAGSTILSNGGIGGNNIGLWTNNTNVVYIASQVTAASVPSRGILEPLDAFNIDNKIDDGVVSAGSYIGANTGAIRTVEGNGATTGDCLVGGNSTTANTYNISGVKKACIVAMSIN